MISLLSIFMFGVNDQCERVHLHEIKDCSVTYQVTRVEDHVVEGVKYNGRNNVYLDGYAARGLVEGDKIKVSYGKYKIVTAVNVLDRGFKRD